MVCCLDELTCPVHFLEPIALLELVVGVVRLLQHRMLVAELLMQEAAVWTSCDRPCQLPLAAAVQMSVFLSAAMPALHL